MFGEEVSYEIEDNYNSKEEKRALWEIAIGLQKTDGLVPSEYLVELAKENINGTRSYDQVAEELFNYHSENETPPRTKEADFSSLRINQILSTDSFSFSPATLLSYHRQLFEGIDDFKHPIGVFRNENITKKEDVLRGKSITYSDYKSIKELLTWDFEEEKKYSYSNLSKEEIVHHAMRFISNLWQAHPFREGNTRTCAVFAIKYLRTLGVEADNTTFKENSLYFRDSLVINNAALSIQTDKFLKMFSENAFLGYNHILQKRDMLEYTKGILEQS
jgi:fido (protein-threonine AMPylation protein)